MIVESALAWACCPSVPKCRGRPQFARVYNTVLRYDGLESIILGDFMIHVSLDNQDETVKHFVLGLTVESGGSVLELNGQAVACVFPAPTTTKGSGTEETWSDAKNARRVELIKKKHTEG